MAENTLTMIPIGQLYPHPNNPRKDLGDLTELAQSIKANGVMQNLTVIPAEQVTAVFDRLMEDPDATDPFEAYVILIGHRRMAAAKLAGLKELPCVVADMKSLKDQIAIMLAENIQRTDLTPYEQAQSFQMMLDMGATVETIARDSGFSETTVRRRVNLLKFKDETFRAATEKQISLDTLSEVAKIESSKTRDEVLASYGGNNFQWKLKQALIRQGEKKNKPAVKKEILAYATEVKDVDYAHYERVFSVSYADYEPGSATPKEMTQGEYVVNFSDSFAVVYKKKEKTPDRKRPQEEIDRENAVRRRESELAALTETAYNLRRDFVTNLTVGKADYLKLMKQACRALIICKTLYYGTNFAEKFTEYMHITSDSQIPIEICAHLLDELDTAESIVKPLVAAIYAAYGDTKNIGYWQKSYGGDFPRHTPNSALDYIYDYLSAFGYELSDEEQSLRDGTHPVYHIKETE